ncbi:hypothetical protein [Roseococcus thiosulfatophilus]|uniref:hypothetical protein n=1 Tax=Roseococcus thiosulfatophilus TaxID=35813 RepID=UPI001A8EE3AA|nr:hypothetical protein [Roseococcus thiosulfatophilus]
MSAAKLPPLAHVTMPGASAPQPVAVVRAPDAPPDAPPVIVALPEKRKPGRPKGSKSAHVKAREAALAAAMCDLLATSSDVLAHGMTLARGLLAKKRDDGRRAALARAIRDAEVRARAVEAAARELKADAARWADSPAIGLPATVTDFLPQLLAHVEDSLGLARLRVNAVCSGCPDHFLAALGIITAGAGADAEPPPEPEPQPETDAERDARELAEMLS